MDAYKILRSIARDGRCLDDVNGFLNMGEWHTLPSGGMLSRWESLHSEGWCFLRPGERTKYAQIEESEE